MIPKKVFQLGLERPSSKALRELQARTLTVPVSSQTGTPNLGIADLKPLIQNAVSLFDPLMLQRGEDGHADGSGHPLIEGIDHPLASIESPAPAQLVGLGQGHMDRKPEVLTPINHPKIEISEGVTNIHDQKNAFQGLPAAEKAFNHGPPGFLDGFGNLGISIPWKVHDAACPIEIEKVQKLRPTRCLTDPRKVPLLGQGIDGTGFSRVRAAGKGHFGAFIGWRILHPWCAGQKLGLMIKGIQHGGPRRLTPLPGFLPGDNLVYFCDSAGDPPLGVESTSNSR